SEEWTITPYSDFFLEAAVIAGHGKVSGDGNITGNLGAEVVYDNGKTKVRAHGHTQLAIGLEDIRDLSTVGIFTNYTQFGVEANSQVTSSLNLQGSVLCSLREYQDSCKASVGGVVSPAGSKLSHGFNVGLITP